MDLKEYQQFCKEGVLQPTKDIGEALIFGLGLAGESGEVCDIIKKEKGHNKPLDVEHLKEELGDVLWYVANLCSVYDIRIQDVIDTNVAKLQKRYASMYKDVCIACGCSTFIEQPSGPHIKQVCSKCGTYHKFVSKKRNIDVEEDLPWRT